MNVTDLRQRAGAALARARALESQISQSEEPTADDKAALDAAIAEANGLCEQVEEAEQRAARFAELEARAKAPGPRVGQPLPHNDPANTRGKHSYSLIRAIQGELAMREGRGSFDGIERETHDELARQRGKAPNGLLVPWDAEVNYRLRADQIQYRDLSTSTGAGAVPNIVRPTMIDVLRARMVTVGLGATVISDMTQPFSLPKTTAAQSAGWVTTEGTTLAAGNPTIGQVPFSYKSVEAKTKLTRQFIAGASVDAERYVVDQLTKAVATTVEAGALTGSGSSGQPKGLFTYTSGDGIGTVALGTNGAAATWANILAVTAAVDTANAPSDSRAWLFNPTTVAFLQGTPKVAGFPAFLLDSSNQVAGYNYASTSLVPNNLTKGSGTGLSALAFGSWGELAIALFSGLDLFIDPYSAQPHVNITMAQDVDVNFLHLASFCTVVDLKTS
jgi:HK97 family phage major capsid protein